MAHRKKLDESPELRELLAGDRIGTRQLQDVVMLQCEAEETLNRASSQLKETFGINVDEFPRVDKNPHRTQQLLDNVD